MKQWNVDVVCAWFEQMGLFMYIADVRRHLRSGNQLQEVRLHFYIPCILIMSILCYNYGRKTVK